MVTVGMLHYRKHPETVFKAYSYAAAAKMEGVEFFYFSPGMVDLENKSIMGYFYINGEWILKETDYPDVIYNAGGALTEKQDKVHEELKEVIPFTSHPIGDKISVYNRIKNTSQFDQYLIPSTEITNPNDVFDIITEFKKVMIKPLSGSKGENVILIKYLNDNIYQFNEEKLVKTELEDIIKELVKSESYLVQAFINSATKEGEACDYRLHTQKDGNGEWVLTTIYPRIANKGVVVNVSNGGYTAQFYNFLEKNYGVEAYNIKRYLEQFALSFSHYFDSLYEEPLDELGIDVGIDQNKKIWLFEVNWRPGQPVLYSLDLRVAKNTIRYAMFLAKK